MCQLPTLLYLSHHRFSLSIANNFVRCVAKLPIPQIATRHKYMTVVKTTAFVSYIITRHKHTLYLGKPPHPSHISLQDINILYIPGENTPTFCYKNCTGPQGLIAMLQSKHMTRRFHYPHNTIFSQNFTVIFPWVIMIWEAS